MSLVPVVIEQTSRGERSFDIYHGSYCEVKEPDLAKCAKRKDFGQGFYLTTSKARVVQYQQVWRYMILCSISSVMFLQSV